MEVFVGILALTLIVLIGTFGNRVPMKFFEVALPIAYVLAFIALFGMLIIEKLKNVQ